MLYPFTLTNILYNQQVQEFGSGRGEPAPGPWYEACPLPAHPRFLIFTCVNTLACKSKFSLLTPNPDSHAGRPWKLPLCYQSREFWVSGI